MATSKSMGQFAPRTSGVRDPRDASKKNGLFWNPVRYLYFGGAGSINPVTFDGSNKPRGIGTPDPGQNAAGPISDRGKGRS